MQLTAYKADFYTLMDIYRTTSRKRKIDNSKNMKKRSEETQTLRAGCSKAESRISPRRRPPPGGAGRPKFNQLEMVTTFTCKPSLVKIEARNFELSW